MAQEDIGGLLFGDDDVNVKGKGKGQKRTAEDDGDRRTKLRRYDRVAAQALNPNGMSLLHTAPLKKVWAWVSKGHKWVSYFTNLAGPTDYRVGVGLSQTAETLLVAFAALNDSKLDKVIVPAILAKAREEAATLIPHLQVMNAGKGSEGGATSSKTGIGMLKQDAAGRKNPSADEIKAAATAFHAWQKAPQGHLRAVLSLMSWGGVWYVAACEEKTSRAFVCEPGTTVKKLEDAITARLTSAERHDDTDAALDDTAGLL